MGSRHRGSLSGKAGAGFGAVRTVVGHANVAGHQKELLRGALHEAWDGIPGFRIDRDNDIAGIQEVAQRLAVVAEYQLGIAAVVSGARLPAISLLEEVLAAGDAPTKYVHRARQELAAQYIVPWMSSGWLVPGADEDALIAASAAAHQSLRVHPNNAVALGLLVSTQYLLGNQAEATRYNNYLNSVDPCRFRMNRAAMLLCEGNYDGGPS